MQHVGIDLGGRESQICVCGSRGKVLLEERVATAKLGTWLSKRPTSRVILETCAESAAVAEAAKAHGHDVRVVAATLVRQLGVGDRGLKTDRRDARALAVASCRVDLVGVHVRSQRARQWQSHLKMRQALVESRTSLVNTVRGWLRGELLAVSKGAVETFPKRVRALFFGRLGELPSFAERQLVAIEALTIQIRAADSELSRLAEQDAVCQRLMTVPGVGTITALYFVSALDEVERFDDARLVQSYLGLTPGERSSSTRRRQTGITKAGPSQVRRMLAQACWSMQIRSSSDPLVQWGRQIAARRGKQVAVVAMSRKLAGILYAMWRDGTDYDPVQTSALISGRWRTAA